MPDIRPRGNIPLCVLHVLVQLRQVCCRLTSLLEVVRIGREQIEVGYGGGDDKLLPTAVAPTTADFDDPPGLHEKVKHVNEYTLFYG